MGSRLLPVVIAAAIALTPFVSTASATSAADPLPSSYVALGDSLTSAWGSGVSDGANVPGDNLPSSWATGSDPVVNSQMLRLEHAGATVSSVVNLAVPGTKVGSANGLVTQADSVPADAGLVLIEAGSSDVCADTSLTPTDAFQTSVEHALTTITQRAPDAKVLIASIPNWYQLWQDFPAESRGNTCPLLFGTDPAVFVATDASRQAVKQATIDYNNALATACASFAACKYDGGAVYGLHFALDDLSTVDRFHPSRTGQAKIAAATFAAGWFASTPVPDLKQFGYTTPGSSAGAPGESVKFGSLFTLSDAASVVDFGFYTTGATSGQSYVPAIYSVDGNGNPDALLVHGDPIIVHPSASAGWVHGPLPSTELQPGKYVLALVSGPIGGGASVAFDTTGGGFFNANDYPTPSDPWGSMTASNQELSLFVDYTVATPDVPVLSGVPADIVAEATGPNGAAVSYTLPTATDPVDGTLPVNCTPPPGTVLPIGATTVACSATNAAHHTVTATFNASVRDTTPPTLQGVPANISVQATSASGATVQYTRPTAQDLVDGTLPVTCAPASGSTFPVGITTVTCSSSDGRQNAASATFSIAVSASEAGQSQPGQPTTTTAVTTTTATTTTTTTTTTPSAPFKPPASTGHKHVAAVVRIRHVWVSRRQTVWISVRQVGGARWWIRVDGKRNRLSSQQGFGRTSRLHRGRHVLRVELASKSGKPLSPPILSQRLIITIP